MRRNRSAAECIGFRYGQDMRDVSENRYQPTRYAVAIYTMFDGYVCCPPSGKKPPSSFDWREDGEAYGRTIYFALGESA